LELSERADEAAAGSRPPGRIGAAAGAGNGFAGEEGTVEEDKAVGGIIVILWQCLSANRCDLTVSSSIHVIF